VCYRQLLREQLTEGTNRARLNVQPRGCRDATPAAMRVNRDAPSAIIIHPPFIARCAITTPASRRAS
jgi:hypothetical protein